MKTVGLFPSRGAFDGAPPHLPSWLVAGRPRRAERAIGFALALLDVAIGLGRKLGGLVAILALAALFVRLLVLGQAPRQLYPGAADPALRMMVTTALWLVLAQGWDLAPERIAADWARLRAYLPRRACGATVARDAAPRFGAALRAARRLGALVDAGVAASNKAGALGALVSLAWLALRFATGATLATLYPGAVDPALSLAADLAVDLLVLSWWTTTPAEIAASWRRFRRGR